MKINISSVVLDIDNRIGFFGGAKACKQHGRKAAERERVAACVRPVGNGRWECCELRLRKARIFESCQPELVPISYG